MVLNKTAPIPPTPTIPSPIMAEAKPKIPAPVDPTTIYRTIKIVLPDILPLMG